MLTVLLDLTRQKVSAGYIFPDTVQYMGAADGSPKGHDGTLRYSLLKAADKMTDLPIKIVHHIGHTDCLAFPAVWADGHGLGAVQVIHHNMAFCSPEYGLAGF